MSHSDGHANRQSAIAIGSQLKLNATGDKQGRRMKFSEWGVGKCDLWGGKEYGSSDLNPEVRHYLSLPTTISPHYLPLPTTISPCPLPTTSRVFLFLDIQYYTKRKILNSV